MTIRAILSGFTPVTSIRSPLFLAPYYSTLTNTTPSLPLFFFFPYIPSTRKYAANCSNLTNNCIIRSTTNNYSTPSILSNMRSTTNNYSTSIFNQSLRSNNSNNSNNNKNNGLLLHNYHFSPPPLHRLLPARGISSFVSVIGKKKGAASEFGDVSVHKQTPLLVYSAIATNVLVMIAKVVAFVQTGSGSILSEVIHSCADIANQCLLAVGLRMSKKAPTPEHPYGFVPERFIFALISAVGVFFLGCGASVYHGIHGLLSPGQLGPVTFGFSVLVVSLVLEGTTFLLALRSLLTGAQTTNMSFFNYVKYAADPIQVAVFCEDGAAVLGVSTAFISLGLSHITGSTVYDSVGSIMIGGLLGLTAIFLIQLNRRHLNYRAIPKEHQTRVLHVLNSDPLVKAVNDVKAVALGGAVWRFKAEVILDGTELAKRHMKRAKTDVGLLRGSLRSGQMDSVTLEQYLVQFGGDIVIATGYEIRRIEQNIRQHVPEARHIDIVHSIEGNIFFKEIEEPPSKE